MRTTLTCKTRTMATRVSPETRNRNGNRERDPPTEMKLQGVVLGPLLLGEKKRVRYYLAERFGFDQIKLYDRWIACSFAPLHTRVLVGLFPTGRMYVGWESPSNRNWGRPKRSLRTKLRCYHVKRRQMLRLETILLSAGFVWKTQTFPFTTAMIRTNTSFRR